MLRRTIPACTDSISVPCVPRGGPPQASETPQYRNPTKVYRHSSIVLKDLWYYLGGELFGILPLGPPPMDNLKLRIDALCCKAIAAPDGSEELTMAMQELRFALGEHVELLRKQLADLRQKRLPTR